MAGAVSLAGMAALRGGAGLVRLAVPEAIADTVAGFEASYMTAPLPADSAGRIAGAAYDRIVELAEKATVIACGPGFGRSLELDQLVMRLYQEMAKPMVFDADALNALATEAETLIHPGGPRILTPHPGEFARLINRGAGGADIPVCRENRGTYGRQECLPHPGEKVGLAAELRADAAVQLAARCGIVVVLKGHRTLITDGGRRAMNSTGDPGMATGGTGDVLTGLITAFACQHLEPFDAARLGVHLHGLAGDLAAAELGEVSLIASDVILFLPDAICDIMHDPAGS